MEYRDWTKKDGSGRDISTSLLGYGCMRFPTLPDGRIDEVRAEKLLNARSRSGPDQNLRNKIGDYYHGF